MSKPYSMDLRERVVSAVEEAGMSRRKAAAHFGVSVRVAIEWVRRFRETGSVAPSQIGGGDIVIMDNLGSHRGKAVRQAIREVGARLFFLPKYSPDLNPIEQVFAKLKHWLRKAAARSFDAVCSSIGDILARITHQECANYFKQAGYERR